ncbi:hypothetical protein [Gilvimarinus sp. 1_MG-2023]|uniref:hypothetical protein n=1 Tax=Gilvimarinus sp. 1_MG-2023 TaxID=3062638 RepID=UPI0026E3CB6A|nr:hypothetical protein [Gilvimarinus sp. 1_MG-2023]MDO6746648.1 hypothetical protein [Gilvimarinus sp. 1_MG-2023]
MTDELDKSSSARQNSTESVDPTGQDYVAIGKTLIALLEEGATLAGLEARQLITTLPKLIMAWLLSLPILLFFWLGLSSTVGMYVYAVSDSAVIGIASFTVLQALCFVLLQLYIKRSKHWMSFPYTRENIRALIEGVQRATSEKEQKKPSENSRD